MDEEALDAGGAIQAARERVVTHVAKKNLIQNAVPIFIELKRLLESKNRPLVGTLMECLRALLKDYKNEFEEILVADKQLQKELMYDMKKYENNANGKAESNKIGLEARSVLKEVNRGGVVQILPLGSVSVPKLKSMMKGGGDQAGDVLESLRRRCFENDHES